MPAIRRVDVPVERSSQPVCGRALWPAPAKKPRETMGNDVIIPSSFGKTTQMNKVTIDEVEGNDNHE